MDVRASVANQIDRIRLMVESGGLGPEAEQMLGALALLHKQLMPATTEVGRVAMTGVPEEGDPPQALHQEHTQAEDTEDQPDTEVTAIEPTDGSETVAADPDPIAAIRDQAWLDRIREGDMSAAGELFDRYHRMIYVRAMRRMGSHDLAEDIAQEVFLRAMRNISSGGAVHFSRRGGAAPWLTSIARNIMLDRVKSADYQRTTLSEAEDLDLTAPPSRSVEDEVIEGVEAEVLRRAVKDLPNPDHQAVIEYRFYRGYSVTKTAEILGINGRAAKSLQHRAVQALRKQLRKSEAFEAEFATNARTGRGRIAV